MFFFSMKRSQSHENGKLVKKLKVNEEQESFVDSQDNLENVLMIDTDTIDTINFNCAASLLNPSPESRQVNTISNKTKDDIEKSIKQVAALTHGVYSRASKPISENLSK